jgi:hypothetical protein
VDPVFAKLNVKEEAELLVLQAPVSFRAALDTLGAIRLRERVASARPIAFALIFCTTQEQVDTAAATVASQMAPDGKLWFAYPKQSSKRFHCDFNRDTGWSALGALGFEGVRQISIDEDWTALRFRRVAAIKTLRRAPSRALSAEGRARVKAAAKKK